MRDFPCGGITKTPIHARKGPHSKPKEQLNRIPSCELLRALIGVINRSVKGGVTYRSRDDATWWGHWETHPSQVRPHRSSLPEEFCTACRQLDRSEGLLSAVSWLFSLPSRCSLILSMALWLGLGEQSSWILQVSVSPDTEKFAYLPSLMRFSCSLLERVFQIRRNYYVTTFH